MRKSFWRQLGILLLVAALLALTTAFTTLAVSADPGLTVTDAILVENVIPGQTITWPMTVSIGNSDPATVITVQVEGMTQGI